MNEPIDRAGHGAMKRAPREQRKRLEKRLTAYSVAAGAVTAAGAVVNQADAGIVYSGIQNIDIQFNSSVAAAIDLNGGGYADLIFRHYYAGATASLTVDGLLQLDVNTEGGTSSPNIFDFSASVSLTGQEPGGSLFMALIQSPRCMRLRFSSMR